MTATLNLKDDVCVLKLNFMRKDLQKLGAQRINNRKAAEIPES